MRINKFELGTFDADGELVGFSGLDWSPDKASAKKLKSAAALEAEFAARDAASFERGFIQGREEGHKTAKAEETENLKLIADALGALKETLAQSSQQFIASIGNETANTIKLATAIARKAVGEVASEPLMKIAENEVRQAISMLAGVPKLVIAAHPETGKAISARLEELKTQSAFDGEIAITADDFMTLQDIRISWHSGRIERITEQLWQEIEKVLGGSAPQDNPKEST